MQHSLSPLLIHSNLSHNMLIVGLTGGIASGKSTVSKLLQVSEVPLIDLDLLAREVVAPNDPSGALKALVKEFGDEILLPSGELDRPALGRIAFNDEDKRRVLNKITHGAIRKRMTWMLLKQWMSGTKTVVVDVPLLVEAGLWKWCGQAVVVWCSPEDQLSRMLSRDGPSGLTEADAKSRLKAQLPLSDKLAYADVILDNSSSASDSGNTSAALKEQVEALVQRWHANSHSFLGRLGWLSCLFPPVGLLVGYFTARRRWSAIEQRKKSAKSVDEAIKERCVLKTKKD